MERIAAEISKRRIRLFDQFRDFDRLRSGYITTEQFRRSLATTQLLPCLEPGQVEQLIAQYSDNGKVAYMAFHRDLESTEVPQTTGGIATSTTITSTHDSDALPLAKAFDEFVHKLNTTGLDLREVFRSFDTHKNGRISITQFERCFPFKCDPKTLKLIVDKYKANSTDVAYLAWVRDMENMAKEARSANAAGNTASTGWQDQRLGHSANIPSPVRGGEQQQQNTASIPQTLETFIAELRVALKTNQVRLAEFLRDGDKHHSGFLSINAFQSGLGRLKLPRLHITQPILDQLTDLYLVRTSPSEAKVQYTRFLQDVDDDASAVVSSPSRQRTQAVSSEDERRVNAVLDKVRIAIRTKRMNLKPTFQDFDRATKSIYATRSCTRTRFERALAINGIKLSVPETDLLVKKYRIINPGETDTDAINYIAFCSDVDVPDSVVESPSAQGPAPSSMNGTMTNASMPGNRREANLSDVIDSIVAQVARRSLRLQDFMRDFDPLRTGTITDEKFTSAISVAGVKLEAHELDLLVNEYMSSAKPQHVLYTKFLRDIDENEPLDATANSPTRIDAVRQRVNEKNVRQTEASLLQRIEAMLERLRETVKSRGLLLPPFFNDYDKHHQGLITAAQFKQVLARHPLPLSSDDCDTLADFFRDPVMTTHVRSRDFIAAVDDTENPTKRNEALSATAAAAAQTSSAANPTIANADAVLARITAQLSRGVRVKEFIRDSDPLRKGFVPENKFAGAIDALGIHLTANEHEVLAQTYRSSRAPNSVDYERFLVDIDSVELQIQSGNRHDLTMPSSGVNIAALKPSQSVADMQSRVDSDPFLARLFERIRSTARSRRMRTRTVLQDYDKLRKGRVTEAQFFGGLSTLSIRFTPQETKAMLAVLASGGNVTYDAFCRLVDDE